MIHETYDIVVLGVGGMGSATLYHLARRGVRVCGIERFGIAHDRGSSSGETRMIRKAYFEHPDYIPLLHRAYELWQALEEECGQRLFVQNGLIVAGLPDSETIQGLEACYRQHELPHEKWTAHEAQKHYPQFRLKEQAAIFYDPTGGFLYVERCIEQHVRLAAENGAVLCTGETVQSWHATEGGVEVETDQRTLSAGRLVIAAGAWATGMLKDAGVDLEIWRKPVFWYTSPNLGSYKPAIFPTFYVEVEYGGFYGFPANHPYGLKVGEHTLADVVADPEHLDRQLRPEDEVRFLRFLGDTFPQLQPKRTHFSVCMYTNTPDHQFILDFHPKYPNVVLGAGFSGHGFKFAPVVGEVLADLALEGTTSHSIDFLRLGRFHSGRRR